MLISLDLIPGLEDYFLLIGGVFMVLLLIAEPNGMAVSHGEGGKVIARLLRLDRMTARLRPVKPVAEGATASTQEAQRVSVAPADLVVEGLSVRFGGVQALEAGSLAL